MQSSSSPFVGYVLQNKTAQEVALMQGCDLGTAKRRLEEALRALDRRRQNCLDAEAVLKANGTVRQEVSRRAWDQVALGLKRAA